VARSSPMGPSGHIPTKPVSNPLPQTAVQRAFNEIFTPVVNIQSQSSTSNPIFANGVSGIFGLGHNRGSALPGIGFSDSIYGQWLPRNPTHDNFTFGMALQPPTPKVKSGDEAGVLHWLKPDPSFYHTDQTTFTPVQLPKDTAQSQANSSSVAHDWSVALDGWQFVIGTTHLSNTESVVAAVDPLFPNIYLPANEAKLIRKDFLIHCTCCSSRTRA
jgi:hypothetical protein